MIIDGKKLAEEAIEEMRAFVRERSIVPTLTAIAVMPDAPTVQFLKIKQKVADAIGVRMETVVLENPKELAVAEATFSAALKTQDGIVLQLPFPENLPAEPFLAHLPSDLDPDCLGIKAGELLRRGEHIIVPPVVAALRTMTMKYEVPLKDAHAVVVGQGRLVGAPAALWLEAMGARVTRLTKADSLAPVKDADILVLGAGVPGLITPEAIKEGVCIFDAGTSEEGGKVVGDADPGCEAKAGLMTPVPGGVGPLAVAMLFANLLTLRFDFGREA